MKQHPVYWRDGRPNLEVYLSDEGYQFRDAAMVWVRTKLDKFGSLKTYTIADSLLDVLTLRQLADLQMELEGIK